MAVTPVSDKNSTEHLKKKNHKNLTKSNTTSMTTQAKPSERQSTTTTEKVTASS